MPQVRITIESLGVRFGSTVALDGVSLDVEPGELLLLLGPSGCGKSTLLRSVAGFVRPTSGLVRFDGQDVTRLGPDERQIGMVFQSFALFPHLSVGENVAFGLRERRTPKAEIPGLVKRALFDMRMTGYAERRVDELSGGEQQRVALARALVTRPQCLLLDEPLSNLDASLRQDMREEIRRVCKDNGLTTLYVTHDQKEAMAVADRIAVMRKGRLEQLGQPHEIYRRPATAAVATFLGETNLLDCTVEAVESDHVVLRVGEHVVRAAPSALARVGARLRTSIRPECLVVRGAPEGLAQLPGNVQGSCFLGELCELALGSGPLRLRSFQLNGRPSDYEVGQPIFWGVAPADVVLLEAEP
ncbi:MAG TPA: ABC transporter ATP-binding protein [Polyangiaceae bacterium]|nr:ABC transporter ATP-binding protein [Polyangiaceae bacterium]